MRVPRLLVPGLVLEDDAVVLDAEASHYLSRVLRRQPGDPVLLGDGAGRLWRGRVEAGDRKRTRVLLDAELEPEAESPLHSHLGIALLRGDRMDYALQKACELGVHQISLLLTERVEVRLEGKRLTNRMQHYQGVLQHAAQQSGRSRIPALAAPVPLPQWAAAQAPQLDHLQLVLDPEAETAPAAHARPAGVTLVTGPEGGLARAEVEQLAQAGFAPSRLGPRVLRAETAPVAALGILQWLYGDLASGPAA